MKKFTFLFLFLSLISLGFSQVNHFQQGFESTSVPSGWSENAMYYNTTANHGDFTGAYGAGFNATNDWLQTPSVNTAGDLSFFIRGSSSSSSIEMKIQKSTNGGSTWTDIVTYPQDTYGTTWESKTVSINDASSSIIIRFFISSRSGNSLYLDDIQLTDFGGTPPAVATPTFNPAAGTYYDDVEVELSCSTGGATIYYTTNGDDPTTDGTEYFSPFDITTTTTVKAAAYLAPGPNKDAGEWSDIAEATYTIEDPIEVATLADLRAAYNNKSATVYEVTGEVFISYQRASRNQKYVQDATAGILIDDASGTITTSYNQYDGITGLIGTLYDYNGLLEFIPVIDPGAATSTGNTLTPIELSIEEMNDEHETYESMLVTIMAAHFDETAVGSNFSSSYNYNIADNDGFSGVFRTAFSESNYIGNPIPEGNKDITGLLIEYNGTAQIAAREMADFTESSTPVIPIGSTGIMIAGLLMAAVIVIRKGRLF